VNLKDLSSAKSIYTAAKQVDDFPNSQLVVLSEGRINSKFSVHAPGQFVRVCIGIKSKSDSAPSASAVFMRCGVANKVTDRAIQFELKEALAAISSDSPSHHLFNSYPLSMCWSCRKFHLTGTCTKTEACLQQPHGQEKATGNQICALLLITQEDIPENLQVLCFMHPEDVRKYN
jgi:hypothetical protein